MDSLIFTQKFNRYFILEALIVFGSCLKRGYGLLVSLENPSNRLVISDF